MPGPPCVEWTSSGFGGPSILSTSAITRLGSPVIPVEVGG
jgi:hypothetical protein